ncbi:MAG: PAS domain S-box protein [Leptospirales bacterium]
MASKKTSGKQTSVAAELKKIEATNIAPGLQIGDVAPDFCLQNSNNKEVCLHDFLKKGPVILSFFRGDWCEYCSEELEGYHAIQNEISASGGTLVAISPQDVAHARKLATQMDLHFEVLSDPEQKVIQDYKIQFTFTPELKQIYQEKFKVDLAKQNADHSWNLPVPATFIIDTNGVIRSRFISMDYAQRMKPKEALQTLDSFTYFQSIFQNAPLAMIVVNNDGIIIDYNKTAPKVLDGANNHSLIGISAIDHLKETESGTVMAELIVNIISGKESSGKYTGDFCPLPNHQQFVNFSVNEFVIKGIKMGAVCIFDDITKQEQQKQELENSLQKLAEQENKYSTLIEKSKDTILILQDGKVLFVNDSASQLLGYRKEQLLESEFMQYVADSSRELVAKRYADRMSGKKVPSIYQLDFKNNNGDSIPVEVNASIIDLKGLPADMVMIRDLTERKKVEKELEESRHSLARAQEIANMGDWTWDMRTNSSTWSDQMYRLFGLTVGETPPDNEAYQKFVHPDDVQAHVKSFEESYKIHGQNDAEYRIIAADGELKYVHSLSEFEQDDKGKNVRMHGVTIDMTKQALQKIELEKSLKKIADQEMKYRGIVETMNEGVVTLDENGLYTYVNQKGLEMLGYTVEEMIGKPSSTHWENLEDRKRFDGAIQMAKTGVRLPDIINENHFIRKDKSIMVARNSARFLYDDNDNFLGMVAVITDIEALKKTQEQLEHAKQQAEAANQTKSEFLSNMSHEIRTPMNAILGFTEILGGMVKDETIKEYVSSIASSGKTLLHLINDILDLSKVEAGKLNVQKEPVNLEQIFLDIKQVFLQKMLEKTLAFEIDIDENLPGNVILDETRVRQVLLNLIGNAMKFTEDGYIKIMVSQQGNITKKEKKKYIDLLIRVEDTGIGIPDNQQKLIFNAFVQNEGQNNKEYGGTGLGLAITTRLVNLMGGEINLQSTLGKGSTFSVTLHDVEISDASVIENTKPPINYSSITFEKATVLVADDIKSNRDLIKGYLQETNLILIEVENGQQAWEAATNEKPNLILMDMKMPVMNGYNATLKIKEDKNTHSIPIVAVTASTIVPSSSDINKVTDDSLHKPFTRDQLFHTLMKYLPYKESDSEPEESADVVESTFEISIETKKMLPKLIEQMEGDFYNQWKSLSDGIIINDIKKFATDIMETSEKYEYPSIQGWAQKLLKHASMYDTEGINITLRKFPDEIAIMKKYL